MPIVTSGIFKEVSPLSPKDCFIVIERLKSSFDFPIHIHPEYELNFIEHAAGAQRIVGDSVETIGNEELVLIANPNLEHAWVNHECKSTNIHEITLQFNHSSSPDAMLEKKQFEPIKRLLERAEKGLVFGRQTIDKVRPLLCSLHTESDSFYSVLKFLVILHELSLADDARELASSSFVELENRKQKDNQIDKIVAYLNANYDKPVHLADVARLVNMSESSFCRYINKRTSKSFVDFLTDMRLGFAVRALVDSSLSVAEICYSCGFNNLSNFNRMFKKRKGMSPSEFRATYLKSRKVL